MRVFRFFAVLTFFLFVIAGLTFSASASDLWVVDTRQTDCPPAKSLETLDFTQLEFKCLQENETTYKWETSTAEKFIETFEPEKPLIVIVHGNWMSYREIFPFAYRFKQLAMRNVKDADCRIVFWSWRSDRTNLNVRKDALLKSQRAYTEARILASCLLHLPKNSKVSLAGFSFGAGLICRSLQLLAEYERAGSPSMPQLQLRAVLLAAAMDQSSLLPNRKYGNALGILDSMLIHVNTADDTLCWYPLLVGIGGPKAIGKEGVFTGGLSAQNRSKITSKNVAGVIGHEHGFMDSLRALLAVQGDFRKYCLFE